MADEADYQSGFHWVKIDDKSPRLILKAPWGRTAATVYLGRDLRGYNWHVWDEDGVGGENSSEPTVEQAKITAESAVLRWGRHFRPRRSKE
jgi:hypothetical protein